jgi:hypothetical protein
MNKKLIIPCVLAILAAVFASQNPDGLDKVSQMLGFEGKGIEHSAVMSGYTIPFLGVSKLSTIFAGVFGVLIIYVLFSLFIAIYKKVRN